MSPRRRQLALSWAAVAVVVVAALAVGTFAADDPTPAERVRSLSSQFACPKCVGQSVQESDAGIAVEIRAEIVRRVQVGQGDGEILGFLESKYPGNLLTPSASGTASLVWALPVAGAVLALAGLAYAFVRWRPRDDVEVDAADRDLVDDALRSRRTGGATSDPGNRGARS
ncbi:MAG: cytochrome c-type biogenesis protein CcmH [Acidimicrobiia bacterium]|nr:cytochrome c-type biogenesis protein CcmH [Acidimicrobiia bacterium]